MILQSEIDKEIELFKEAHLAKITGQLSGHHELEPCVSILGYDFPSKSFGVINIPVGDALTSPNNKEVLYRVAIPKIFQLFTDNFRQVICFSFASEAWMWVDEIGKGEKPLDIEKLKSGPKKEVVFVSFECEGYSEMTSFTLYRHRGRVSLTDKMVMDTRDPDTRLSGDIPQLFRKYNRMKQT